MSQPFASIQDSERPVLTFSLVRRFKQMCFVNTHRKLKELMGEKVKFRVLQEKTMHAIIIGQSLIVNIMATRERKSILFMLLRYCVNRGTTVVIILLCSLQEDLKRQCREACIEWV
jgi:superfamily II DNA helicase RecQ